MELRAFAHLQDAHAWYAARASGAPADSADAMFLAICRGEDARAEELYRRIDFPSRWWDDLAYVQGHYLLRLRRRDRLLELLREARVAPDSPRLSADPWADLAALAEHLAARTRRPARDAARASLLHCLLGHAYLAMDYHEAAAASYRAALSIDAAVHVAWENMSVFERVRAEVGVPR